MKDFNMEIEKSELRKLYERFNKDLTDCSCAPGYWDILDEIIKHIDELKKKFKEKN